MNEQQYSVLIKEVTSKQALIARHTKAMKLAETAISNAMIEDNISVVQGKTGIVTYKSTLRSTTVVNLIKLFKQVKISLFLELVSFNASQAKPLIKSGEIDSKLIDSVTSIIKKEGIAKLKVTPL
jgi:hypothetical protein